MKTTTTTTMKEYPCGHFSRVVKPRENCQACYKREWYHKRGGSKKIKAWAERNKEHILSQEPKWPSHGLEYANMKQKEYAARLKRAVMSQYGDSCACCGETQIEFLQIDHIGGGGRAHRRDAWPGGGFYLWLKKRHYPDKDKLRVLCANCNTAVKFGKTCPHETLRTVEAMLLA